MKKTILLSCILSIVVSCNSSKNNKYIITDFKESITDTLHPVKGGKYSAKIIKLKGYVDDTVKVNFGKNTYEFKYSGNIDVILNPDYYGESPAIFIYEPYKAKSGELEIEFSIK